MYLRNRITYCRNINFLFRYINFFFQDMKKYSDSVIHNMEKWSKIMIPIFFALFNLFYWIIYGYQFLSDQAKYKWIKDH